MNKDLLKFVEELSATDTKTLSQKALKMTEEVGELAKAVLPYESAHGTTHRFVDRSKILEECADIWLVNASIAFNLGFTYEELEAMVQKKSLKWAGLQRKESEAKYPVPYEIHITVSNAEVERFKSTCASIGIKPLLLDLQNNAGSNVLFDLMTSQIHTGNNTSAYKAMMETSSKLKEAGFNVIREKIETVPWHPAAPSIYDGDPKMPPNCYFESHIAVIVKDDHIEALHSAVSTMENCHLSKSVFKKLSADVSKVMVTYREYNVSYEDFKEKVTCNAALLDYCGFEYEDPIIEFSIFDTKISHDAAWINSK